MRCKQNDLAFVRKAVRTSNIGKIVTCKEVLGKFKAGETIVWNGEHHCSPDDDYIWIVSASNLETLYGPSREAMIPDSWLTPLKATPEEVEEKSLELA